MTRPSTPPEPQIHLRREDDGMIEIRFRLTAETVRAMTITEAATLGVRIQDAARKLA